MKVLWLRPSKGENISVRRERIAEKLEQDGFEVVIQDASGTDLPSAVWTALRGDFDVIAGNVRIGLYAGYPLARLLRKPFLGDVSDPISDIESLPKPLFSFFEWYEWQVLSRADATVFVYESSYREAKQRGISTAVKLPNAVDYDLFADPDESAVSTAGDILRSHGVNLDKPLAIYLGVFSPNYCIEEILAAAELTPDWEFLFLGEGDLIEEVTDAAKRLTNFHYPGAFEYRLMPGFLSYADVGFCFKDAEQPLKIKEYGAAGIPAIVRPGELSKWYGEDELVFTEAMPDAISETLERLRADKTTREQYAANLQNVAREYSWKKIAEEYRQLFEALGSQ